MKPLNIIFSGAMVVAALPVSAEAPERFTWCALGVIGNEVRMSSIFMAEEGRGSEVMSDNLEKATGQRPPRQLLCKQFATMEEAEEGLVEMVRAMREADLTASQLDMFTGRTSPL